MAAKVRFIRTMVYEVPISEGEKEAIEKGFVTQDDVDIIAQRAECGDYLVRIREYLGSIVE
jgi:D-serine dehydratase